jgi:PhnB protein
MRPWPPWIVTRDTAREIEFLIAAFDGEELGRMHDQDGLIVHAEVRLVTSSCCSSTRRRIGPIGPPFCVST